MARTDPVQAVPGRGAPGAELGRWQLGLRLGVGGRVDVRLPEGLTLLVRGEGWVDLPRSYSLWNDVFKGHDALVRKGGWVDKASIGIPALYIQTGFMLADALETVGDTAGLRAVLAKTEAVAKATRLDQFLDFSVTPPPLPSGGDTGSPAVVPLPKDTGTPKAPPRRDSP